MSEVSDYWKPELEAAQETISRLSAELHRLRNQESRWQPIETAPKDGTKIVAYVKDIYGDAHQIHTTCWNEQYDGSGRWTWFTSHFPPTHWMPLPLPPE